MQNYPTESNKEEQEEREREPKAKRRKQTDVSPPAYGSQEYWENRYRRQFDAVHEEVKGGTESTTATETSPYHAWYYSYADLRPLIVPLLLGGRNDLQDILKKVEEETSEEEENDDDEEKKEINISEDANKEIDKEEEVMLQDKNDGASRRSGSVDKISSDDDDVVDDDDDDDGFVEDNDDEDDDEDVVVREGLSKKGPVSVLEIGCGDVPLGVGLALDFKDLEENTMEPAATLVKQILCTDYSSTVVTTMKSKYRKFQKSEIISPQSTDIGNIPLDFAVADARKLDYANDSFELILEKGTLDAMLSDKEEGAQNCVQIIRECARVLTKDGYLVLVSHLNAHTEPGLQWLSDVVFEGLRGCDPDASWSIEVHGNAEIQDDSSSTPSGSPGPAVYVIRKKSRDPSVQIDDTTIPVNFFAY